jgi:hypothetical protein
LVERTHHFFCKNINRLPMSDVENDPSQRTIKTKNHHELLDEMIEQLNIVLMEFSTNTNEIERFDLIKCDLRELFLNFMKEMPSLKKEVATLKDRVSQLEIIETDANDIQMGNIAAQLRNKIIRYIKPNLSKRAARDEHLQSLLSEKRGVDLTHLIQTHDPTMTASDISRSISALMKRRAIKAHDEMSIPVKNIEHVLDNYVAANDQYLGEQAMVVVKYLKILADDLHEPLIVDLGH